MEIRYQPDQTIRLNVLGGTSPTAMSAQIVRMAGRRAQLRTNEALTCGTAVKLEMEDSLLLGEVSACSKENGQFLALIEVREAIPSMSDLARLISAVMDQGRGGALQPQPSVVRAARA
jgi:hypothetical protein